MSAPQKFVVNVSERGYSSPGLSHLRYDIVRRSDARVVGYDIDLAQVDDLCTQFNERAASKAEKPGPNAHHAQLARTALLAALSALEARRCANHQSVVGCIKTATQHLENRNYSRAMGSACKALRLGLGGRDPIHQFHLDKFREILSTEGGAQEQS